MNDLDTNGRTMLMKFACSTNMGGNTNTEEDWNILPLRTAVIKPG